jgi:hypothetical protein
MTFPRLTGQRYSALIRKHSKVLLGFIHITVFVKTRQIFTHAPE